jgi:hypothetical protein
MRFIITIRVSDASEFSSTPHVYGSRTMMRLVSQDMGAAVTKLIDRYFAAMRERDIEALMALFAADAVMVLPDGRELSDAKAIRGMYEYLFATDPPNPAPMATIISSIGGAAEIETKLGDGSSRQTANFFHVDNEGRIRRLSVYRRG